MLKELGKIFGSVERVKLMRFFLAHPDLQIEVDEVVKRLRIKKPILKKEIKNLETIGMLTPIILEEDIEIKMKSGKSKFKTIKSDGLELNRNYTYADKLAELLLDFRFISREDLLDDLKKFGKIKLLAIGGIFVKDEANAKLDLLLVGDALDKEKMDYYLRGMEADFGTEIRFSIFESEEFNYRLNMFDRLIKDFLKSPHEKIVEKINTRG